MQARPYPRYRPSGVEWLGEVPEHWEVKRLKYSASINDEALPESTDPSLEISYVDISSVDAVRGIVAVEEMVFENAPSRARRVVRDGDTIISTVRTYLRAIAPVRHPEPGTIVSTGLAVVRPCHVAPAFMSYALREQGFVDAIVARSVGVSYPAVNASEIGKLPIPLPDDDEQHAIADFLDGETLKIDTLVAKKRTLIERLKEKRTALISRTVTRGLPPDAARAAGLDPHPKLKPSGIDWLGDVPEHWEVKRSDTSVTTAKRQIPPEAFTAVEVMHYSIPVVQEIGTGAIENGEDIASAKQLIDEQVVLVSRLNPRKATICRAAPHGEVLTLASTEFVALKPTEGDIRFLEYLVSSELFRQRLDSMVQSVTRSHQRARPEEIYRFWSAWPNPAEQHAIADFLERETGQIDGMVSKVEAALDRLQEYRNALITAAVTGKIDVRAAHG